MERIIDPLPLDAETRLGALIDALAESVERRVSSIVNGEGYFAAHPGSVIPMPEHLDIFLTEGAWEDFSTPARDLRLLIAIDVVRRFPRTLPEDPGRWGYASRELAEQEAERLNALLEETLGRRNFRYTRSDGSTQELSLAQLIARAPALELGWNPNDCPELRWGAPPSSEEASTCRRHAPAEQRQRMEGMRTWFATRSRPTR